MSDYTSRWNKATLVSGGYVVYWSRYVFVKGTVGGEEVPTYIC